MNNWQRDEQKTVTDTMVEKDGLINSNSSQKQNKQNRRPVEIGKKKKQKEQGSDKSLRTK